MMMVMMMMLMMIVDDNTGMVDETNAKTSEK